MAGLKKNEILGCQKPPSDLGTHSGRLQINFDDPGLFNLHGMHEHFCILLPLEYGRCSQESNPQLRAQQHKMAAFKRHLVLFIFFTMFFSLVCEQASVYSIIRENQDLLRHYS